MGRHLYLIALPSQHGLSQYVPGSLSHVIGFLPEDKALHDEKVSFRCSSSFHLNADTGPQIDQPTSFTCLCQQDLQLACDAKSDPSFDLMPSKGEVAISGGELRPSLKTTQPST